MGQKVFIPLTDEMLYQYPELITAPLRPYQIDNPCFHWMATVKSDGTDKPDKVFHHRTPPHNKSDQTGSRLA